MNLKIRLSGVTFDNRQQLLAHLSVSEPIQLRRDYFNRHDRNATGVYNSRNEQLGWIPREHAVHVALFIDEGKSYSSKILRKLGGNGYNYGLEILITLDDVKQKRRLKGTNFPKTDVQVAFQRAHYYFYSEQDFNKAAHWFKVCGNVASAYYYLGFLHQHGLGVQQDCMEAVRYYRLGADNGVADSAFHLAYLYLTGSMVRKDETEALKWFQVAAEQEHVDAYFNLAYMYEHGVEIPTDSLAAQEWLELAMEKGDFEAEAIIYEEKEFKKDSIRAPYQLLKLLSDHAEMKFYQNLLELHEQNIEFLHYSEELEVIEATENKMQRYLLFLQYFIKVERESRILRDQQRERIRPNCIPNYFGGQLDLFDASVLLDEWCDDMEMNRRNYLNAFRFDTVVEFMCKSLLKTVQTNTGGSDYWLYDYLNVLSRAMINLAVCYRNMNMFHSIPSSVTEKGIELAVCSYVIYPFDVGHPDHLTRLEASAFIYDFFKEVINDETVSILNEKRNTYPTLYQKCRCLKEFFKQFYKFE